MSSAAFCTSTAVLRQEISPVSGAMHCCLYQRSIKTGS